MLALLTDVIVAGTGGAATGCNCESCKLRKDDVRLAIMLEVKARRESLRLTLAAPAASNAAGTGGSERAAGAGAVAGNGGGDRRSTEPDALRDSVWTCPVDGEWSGLLTVMGGATAGASTSGRAGSVACMWDQVIENHISNFSTAVENIILVIRSDIKNEINPRTIECRLVVQPIQFREKNAGWRQAKHGVLWWLDLACGSETTRYQHQRPIPTRSQ
jgi:hypothetical protein